MGKKPYVRQLATIVNVDTVGYSLMMGRDEDRTLTAFEERRAVIYEICERHGGRMFGAAGDSVMAEFGSPIDAIRAVLEFQEQIAEVNKAEEADWKMVFRAGVNTGDAIVRGDLLIGDDVNIAARLQSIAPPGGAVVSETTFQHINGILAAQFVFLGEQNFKNIAYRVGAYSCWRKGQAIPESAGDGMSQSSPASPAIVPAIPGGPPAVAVLPFRNISDNREIEFVADGIAGDIAAGLSNTRWLPVIARGSTSQFRDESLDSVTAGKTLGAGYVVSGTLMGDDKRLRLNAVLEDVSAARTIWSRRYDRDFSGIMQLQDELGAELVSMLAQQVDHAEQVRTFQIPWEDLETWQLVRRGRWHMQRRSSEDTGKALNCFEQALQRDPNSSSALGEIAWWYFWRAWTRLGDPDDLDRVESFARKALYMDSQDARPHAYIGACEIMRKRPHRSIGHFDEALRIDPSYAFALSASGSARLLLGQTKDAVSFFESADRLSPVDIYRFHNLGELASAHFHNGNLENAVKFADRSSSLSPGYFLARVIKAAALLNMGRPDDAHAETIALYQRQPDFGIERVEWIPYVDRKYNRTMIDAWQEAANPDRP